MAAVCVSVYLVHDGGRRGFDAWLLVREGELLQQVHIGQGILQGHVGRHGNKASLTQHPSLTEREKGDSENKRFKLLAKSNVHGKMGSNKAS